MIATPNAMMKPAMIVVVTAVAVALPLHYVYGLATLGHLGTLYVDVAALIVGAVLSLRASSSDRVARR